MRPQMPGMLSFASSMFPITTINVNDPIIFLDADSSTDYEIEEQSQQNDNQVCVTLLHFCFVFFKSFL